MLNSVSVLTEFTLVSTVFIKIKVISSPCPHLLDDSNRMYLFIPLALCKDVCVCVLVHKYEFRYSTACNFIIGLIFCVFYLGLEVQKFSIAFCWLRQKWLKGHSGRYIKQVFKQNISTETELMAMPTGQPANTEP